MTPRGQTRGLTRIRRENRRIASVSPQGPGILTSPTVSGAGANKSHLIRTRFVHRTGPGFN